jgi:hypothetical protein
MVLDERQATSEGQRMTDKTFEVKATPQMDGKIDLETYVTVKNVTSKIAHMVMDTQERATRQALESLGWTPPDASSKICLSQATIDRMAERIYAMRTNHQVHMPRYDQLPSNMRTVLEKDARDLLAYILVTLRLAPEAAKETT